MKNYSRPSAFTIPGFAGSLQLNFLFDGVQHQKLQALFSRKWDMETHLSNGVVAVRLIHKAPELVAVIDIDPDASTGPARLAWIVDDLSDLNGVTKHEGSKWLELLIELADHLERIRPLSPSFSIPLEA